MPIVPFSHYNLASVPAALRLLATQIELGTVPVERCILVIEDLDGGVGHKAFGPEPFSRAHAAGLCQAASLEILGALPSEEDSE